MPTGWKPIACVQSNRAWMPNCSIPLRPADPTLERLVRDRVFQVAAQKLHLAASDATLARELQKIPAIANLRKADGSLDTEGYRNLLAAQGMTPEGFEASVRRDISLGQVLGGVMNSCLAHPADC